MPYTSAVGTLCFFIFEASYPSRVVWWGFGVWPDRQMSVTEVRLKIEKKLKHCSSLMQKGGSAVA